MTFCLALVAGCSAGKEYDVARKAELAGEAPKAYDGYLKAAEKHSADGGVIGGLKRTAPAAADFWESEAILAANEGRYDDAWRMWMRVLEIQPGHPTAPGVIRQLEQDHGSAIALARADYLRGGSRTLARVEPSGRALTSPPPREPVVIARADARGGVNRSEAPARVVPREAPPDQAVALEAAERTADRSEAAPRPGVLGDEPPDGPLARSDGEDVVAGGVAEIEPARRAPVADTTVTVDGGDRAARGEPGEPREEKPPPVAGTIAIAKADAAPAKPAEPAKPESGELAGASKSEAAKPASPAKPEADQPASPPKPAPPPAESVRPKVEKPAEPPRKPTPPPPSTTSPAAPKVPDYLACRILSKKDRRYPQSAALVDGISVKLRDTDDDLEADLDLLDGNQRIKKVRDLPVGRSCAFRGRSGKYYQLTVLGVEHKTRTVRLGVRPV
jgi:hypothetical protein